ncbi:unnamed protein product [Wickerhamomyces anomalus]
MFGLGKLFYAILLLVNAIAVLSEDRFLKRSESEKLTSVTVGLGQDTQPSFNPNNEGSTKSRIINLISAIQTLLRIPLIVVNTVVIIYELILG